MDDYCTRLLKPYIDAEQSKQVENKEDHGLHGTQNDQFGTQIYKNIGHRLEKRSAKEYKLEQFYQRHYCKIVKC